MILELFDLSLLSLRHIKGLAVVRRRVAHRRQRGSCRHELRELLQRVSRSWTSRRISGAAHKLPRLKSGLCESIDAIELGLDAVEAGCGPTASGVLEVWHGAVFNDQT